LISSNPPKSATHTKNILPHATHLTILCHGVATALAHGKIAIHITIATTETKEKREGNTRNKADKSGSYQAGKPRVICEKDSNWNCGFESWDIAEVAEHENKCHREKYW
jgi:hypothetical protein